MKKIAALAVVAVLAACSSSPAWRNPSSKAPTTLNVIATTDFHGAVDGEEAVTGSGQKITIGGAGVYATYIKILKKNLKGPTLWIDSGDLFQGSMVSNRFEGAPVVRMFNYLGLQATALGNHEFDYGPVGEKAVPRSPSDDPRGALKQRIKEAGFPFLAANLRNTDGSIPEWIKPSVVIPVDGLRVGVVGAASPGTPGSTNALNLPGLKFLPLLPSVQTEAERLRREERVDAVIVTMHVGALCDNNDLSNQTDLSSCKTSDSESLDFAKALPSGLVDLILTGHTHRGTAKVVNNVAVLQTYSNGKYVGWAKVDVNSHTSEVAGLTPVCTEVVQVGKEKTCDPFLVKRAKGAVEPAKFFGESITPDAKVVELLAPEVEKVRKIKDTLLNFQALDEITRDYSHESPLGNLVADVSKEMIPGADLGLTNGGGLRANLAAKAMTYGDIFNVLPFDNQVATMKISGKYVADLVKVGLFGGGGVYSWSSNMKIEANNCDVTSITVDGEALDPKKIYTVVTSDFLAGGGSGVSSVKIPKDAVEIFWDAPYILRDQTAGILRKWHKDIRSSDFYSASAPRQKLSGRCGNGNPALQPELDHHD